MEIRLFDDYVLREVSAEEFGPFFQREHEKAFEQNIHIPVEDWLTDEEKTEQKQLSRLLRERYVLRAIIYRGETPIGWHVGWQTDAATYYMTNSAVLREYRGHGVYSEMVVALIEHLRERGFQRLTSRHLASNNPILTLKLRAGFHITGMEVDERFGILVCLSYIFSEQRRNAYRFRIGSLRPDVELRRFL